MSISIASQSEPTDLRGITNVADGINHAIPTHKELQKSIKWLSEKGLLTKLGKKYSISPKGKVEYENASQKSHVLLKIWENLEERLKNYA